MEPTSQGSVSPQQQAIAFSVQSIVQSGNAVLQRVAETAWEYLSSETKIVSHERRLQRFISERPASRKRVREYAKRMRVEATFQDQKSRGCMIECSRFSDREQLDRWLFAVHLAIWWMAHLGNRCMHHGQYQQLDRTDRRDKGWFRIGRLWLKAILKKANRDLSPPTRSRVAARLANCLPFFHRDHCLCFSLYLQ